METGLDGRLGLQCGPLDEPATGIDGADHLTQGGGVAGKHERSYQAAYIADSHRLGCPELRRHAASYAAQGAVPIKAMV